MMINTNQPNLSQALKRARPLLYLVLLLSAWVMARIIFTLSSTQANDADLEIFTPQLMRTANAEMAIKKPIEDYIKDYKNGPSEFEIAQFADDAHQSSMLAIAPNIDAPLSPVESKAMATSGLPKSYYPLLFFRAMEERSTALSRPQKYAYNNGDLPSGNGPAISVQFAKTPPSHIEASQSKSRLSGYAYIFARTDNGDANALGGRYGGSQAAIQAAYRLNPEQKTVIDATLRAQSAFRGDREIAAGVRFKPNKNFPIAAIAERRFRPSNPDGYAFYVAGGKSNIALPADFKLNSYGQAGLSTAGKDTLFFDGQAIAERPLYKGKNVEISAGGGAWTGGQRGASRLDIGPSVSIKLSSGSKNYRISGDWRERIGGNALPNSGAAITLSTDF